MRFGFSQKKSYICIRNTEGTDCIAVPSFFTPKNQEKTLDLVKILRRLVKIWSDFVKIMQRIVSAASPNASDTSNHALFRRTIVC